MKSSPLKRSPLKRKPKKKKEKTPKQIATEAADDLWAKIIKKRDKFCIVCGSTIRLNAHHIFSRRYRQTRHDLTNGITLCWAHHRNLAHGDPEKFRDFLLDLHDEVWYNTLKAKAYVIGGDYNPQQNLKELDSV